MNPSSLLFICVTAFFAVFVILSLLALIMRLMTTLFPDKEASAPDGPILAAIHTAAARAHPGMQVTKIEEIK